MSRYDKFVEKCQRRYSSQDEKVRRRIGKENVLTLEKLGMDTKDIPRYHQS